MKVDPGEHLRLLTRVVGQMGFQGSEADEAWSEGLVAITEAAQSYDPKYNTTVASWLAKNIRWNLAGWRRNQRYTLPMPADVEYTREDAYNRVKLNELLVVMKTHLTDMEQHVILLTAMGFTGKEIAQHYQIEPMQISRIKRKAQSKLKVLDIR